MPTTQQEILKALSTVQDPERKQDVVSLGYVKDLRIEEGKVHFRIESAIPPGALRDRIKAQAEQAVSRLAGVSAAEVLITSLIQKSPRPLIKNIVPVASGKGGVGKSTVSVNLALALAKQGARVGIMDADVYGPTVPTLLGLRGKPQAEADNRLIPMEAHGLKVMSMGFFIPEGEAVVWRGPMLHKAIEQFWGGVLWGELDYLIVDLPPGTGDVQLSLCQTIPLTGAVIVSTPQEVALQVATKAIAMFKKLNCPLLGLIENMSYYLCSHCGKREEIFGSGGARKASEKLGIPFLGEIPLATTLRISSDEGKPVVVSDPSSSISKAFFQVADGLTASIQKKGTPEGIKISF